MPNRRCLAAACSILLFVAVLALVRHVTESRGAVAARLSLEGISILQQDRRLEEKLARLRSQVQHRGTEHLRRYDVHPSGVVHQASKLDEDIAKLDQSYHSGTDDLVSLFFNSEIGSAADALRQVKRGKRVIEYQPPPSKVENDSEFDQPFHSRIAGAARRRWRVLTQQGVDQVVVATRIRAPPVALQSQPQSADNGGAMIEHSISATMALLTLERSAMRKVQAQQALAQKAAAAAAREAAFAAEQKKKAEATAVAEEAKINALRDGDDTVSIAALQSSVQRAAKVQALLLENDTAPRAQESSDDTRRETRDARSKALAEIEHRVQQLNLGARVKCALVITHRELLEQYRQLCDTSATLTCDAEAAALFQRVNECGEKWIDNLTLQVPSDMQSIKTLGVDDKQGLQPEAAAAHQGKLKANLKPEVARYPNGLPEGVWALPLLHGLENKAAKAKTQRLWHTSRFEGANWPAQSTPTNRQDLKEGEMKAPDASAATKPSAEGGDAADGVKMMADPQKYANAVKEWAEGGMGKAPEVCVCVCLCDCAIAAWVGCQWFLSDGCVFFCI
jgi:hypothetical protein